MELLLTRLTRRPKGGIARKDEEISADVVSIGRGTDNEIFLDDPRVPLQTARLHFRSGQIFLESSTHDFRVNGVTGRQSTLSTGDVVTLGPYEMTIVEAPDGKDVSLTVEHKEPMGDDTRSLIDRSTLSLQAAGLRKRRWAWGFSLVILAAFLVAPIAMGFLRSPAAVSGPQGMTDRTMLADISWKSGEMLASHEYFKNDCQACHVDAFIMVQNEACIACHQKQGHHYDTAVFSQEEDDWTRCASCHKDHQGPAPRHASRQAICVDCHEGLADDWPTTKLADVEDFSDHPQFRPSVMTSPPNKTVTRISLDDNPKEISNLKFPHKLHMDPTKMRTPDRGTVKLECADCHVTDVAGQLMEPIQMEVHCIECHQLDFDKTAPTRVVTHGKPDRVYSELLDFYSGRALEGGVPDVTAPAVVRRRPGTPLPEASRPEAFAWAKSKADETAVYMFSVARCGQCHYVDKGTAGDARPDLWTVQPVATTVRWQPKSVFSHTSHKDMACEDCHAATQSEESSDVLLPKIDNCQQCHAGEGASAKVASTCISCHVYHQPGLTPMGGETAGLPPLPSAFHGLAMSGRGEEAKE